MTSNTCPICLAQPEKPLNICIDSNHELICQDCWVSYIENAVNSAYFGSCPAISCPSAVHQQNKKRKLLQFEKWKTVVPSEVSSKYASLASHLLAFLCGGCHALKSLDLGFEANLSAQCYKTLHKSLSDSEGRNDRYPEFEKDLLSFCVGDVNVEEFYTLLLSKYFTQLVVQSDNDAWEVFSSVLKTIPEPERRANLHLRYLRDRPRIKTLCCNREHCFKCKVKDFHDGKTCSENSASLDHSIVCCPSCGIALARGDGCNTITCVCGKQFSWSVEKEHSERCVLFLRSHPDHPSADCAHILCTQSNAAMAEFVQARSWQSRNRMEVSRQLRHWLRQRYWPCVSQCCTVLPLDTLPEGVREAVDLWRTEHAAEVERCKQQNEVALQSIFETFAPIPSDRAAAAHRLSALSRRSAKDSGIDDRLVLSAQRWIESHKDMYTQGVAALEERSAKQFLRLFGSRPFFSLRPSHVSFPAVFEFDRATSNPDLTFTRNYTAVERVGSVSCYPAAFALLPAEKCLFKVLIEAAPRTSNWLTFGLAVKGMAAASSDGVGRTANTWGLSDDRSSASSQTLVASCGTEMGHMRKLRQGDVLCCLVDVAEGWIELQLNESEHVVRMSIPPGSPDNYVYAMTFANDHRVSILFEPSIAHTTNDTKDDTPRGDGIELNKDHTVMLQHFKKQLKALLADEDLDAALMLRSGESETRPTQASALQTDGAKWLEQCGKSMAVAREQFERLRPHLDHALGLSRAAPPLPADFQALSALSVLDAASWYKTYRDVLHAELLVDMAMNFSLIHGDEAPFLAAMLLADPAKQQDKDELRGAAAFVKYFAEDMQEWYIMDGASSDPLLEHVAPGCMCVPRHIRSCPLTQQPPAAKK